MIERILADDLAVLGLLYLAACAAFAPFIVWCSRRWDQYRQAMWRDYVRRQRAAGRPVESRRAA